PPAIEMYDVRGRGEVEPGAPGLERKHEERHILVLLESAHQVLAFAHFGLAVQDEPGAAEYAGEKRGERRGDFPELAEDKRLLLAGRDLLGYFARARKLPAVFVGPGIVAEPLRRMIADLL